MMAFHSVLAELAAREVRFVRTGSGPEALAPGLPADEYAYFWSCSSKWRSTRNIAFGSLATRACSGRP
jgi:hypothetical protein